jgi:histidine ammonia-lyase
MGSISALKLFGVLKNTIRVLAVELLTATQALDFRVPLKPGRGVELAHNLVRAEIQHADQDYEVRNDLDTCAEMIRNGLVVSAVSDHLSGLQ